jgi:enoyl-CoA hydratase/carnithine racemase
MVKPKSFKGSLKREERNTRYFPEKPSLGWRLTNSGLWKRSAAVKAHKRAIHKGVEFPLQEALRIEMEEYDRVARSKDAEEGITSFIEKKVPTFTGS